MMNKFTKIEKVDKMLELCLGFMSIKSISRFTVTETIEREIVFCTLDYLHSNVLIIMNYIITYTFYVKDLR